MRPRHKAAENYPGNLMGLPYRYASMRPRHKAAENVEGWYYDDPRGRKLQ